MGIEPTINVGNGDQLIGCCCRVAGKSREGIVILERALRDVVGALPRRACVGGVVQIFLILAGKHVEGIERRVVVVAEPAPDDKLTADVHLLL